MAEATDIKGQILQNLKDAGCEAWLINEFMGASSSQKHRQQLLAQHRKRLLERLHRSQKQIDCLDYLAYRIKKQEETR